MTEISRRNFLTGFISIALVGPAVATSLEYDAEPAFLDSIHDATKSLFFEVNDNITRSKYRETIGAYLRDLQNKGKVYDWLVVCDETNNTPEIIDRNEFKATILVMPTRKMSYKQYDVRAHMEMISIEGIIKDTIEKL